jgi:hypothetical protein
VTGERVVPTVKNSHLLPRFPTHFVGCVMGDCLLQ